MVRIYSVTHSFSNCRHTMIHTTFKINGTHPVTHSFSNGRATPSFTLVLNWSGHTRLNTRFQLVGTHRVTHSFSNCGDTSGYYTRFQKIWTPGYTFISNGLETLGYMLVFKWSCHTEINTCFQMVCKHPVTHLYSNG